MSGRNRTIVLQAVSVALLVAVVFFAFLRPSDPGDLAGIDAPGEAPSFGPQGTDRRDGEGRRGGDVRRSSSARAGARRGDRGSAAGDGALTTAGGPRGGPDAPPTADGPTGDQYTSVAIALMERVKAAEPGDSP